MLRKLKTPDACFCLRKLERRRSAGRREQRCQRANENAQPSQSGQAQEGLERGQHLPEFSRLLAGQLKRKGYSFGPRSREAPQMATTRTTFSFSKTT
jgi:hypothetical protein